MFIKIIILSFIKIKFYYVFIYFCNKISDLLRYPIIKIYISFLVIFLKQILFSNFNIIKTAREKHFEKKECGRILLVIFVNFTSSYIMIIIKNVHVLMSEN